MEKYLQDLLEAFNKYFITVTEGTQWWMPLGIFFIVLIVVLAGKRWLSQNKPVLTREFMLLVFTLKVTAVVQTILLVYFLSNWMDGDFYKETFNEGIHILTITVLLILPVSILLYLRNGFAREKIYQNLRCAITRKDEANKNKQARQSFKNAKLWSLIPLLAFLLLFFANKEKGLVSLVIDNSTSTRETLPDYLPALKNNISLITHNTDVIITKLTNMAPRNSFEAIINERDPYSLEGTKEIFKGGVNALRAIEQMEYVDTSPLIETIWANFLITRQKTQEVAYDKTLFVIITDGDEGMFNDRFNEFFCEIPAFNNFYDDRLNIVYLNQVQTPFLEKIEQCGYLVFEEETNNMLQLVLKDVINDPFFPPWLAIITGIGIIIIFLINPKNK